ncbi:G_PROTEIN_RECEP_F1_2 domain-containing protein [Meloidogyne graminicola]|uniref:G_PROTEIN_RECEP_F1_2 domain-containing protein n=1 Tax=Meloidogyne graminicola TaxID=189291 RepID=A0A8S9ZTB6_9BILA|nr:G_PROTEIN_RECEP_F1_2 domain-containing protein [Meloidogyne graminicola]
MNNQICLPYELLRLHESPIESFFFVWIFPWLFLLGVLGNSLNLLVLLGPKWSLRRADSLLQSLAICDIIFLFLLLPSSLAQFDHFGQQKHFRVFYLSLRVHLIGFANWCSAVAIWLIIAISTDRLIGIVDMEILDDYGLLTSYNHFSYHCVLKWLCNGGQVVGKCFDILQESWPGNHTNKTPHPLRAYVRLSLAANALLVVLLPVLLMFLLNAGLLFIVRRRSFSITNDKCSNYFNNRRQINNNKFVNQQTSEQHITVSIAAIVTAFTLTQGPSALVLLARLSLVGTSLNNNYWEGWQLLGSLTGFLVILGKSLNCILLCLSSASFRKRLSKTINDKIFKNKKRNKEKRKSSAAYSLTSKILN